MNKLDFEKNKMVLGVEERLMEYYRPALKMDREKVYDAIKIATQRYIKLWGFDTVKNWIAEWGPGGEKVYFEEIIDLAMEILGLTREYYDD